MSYPRYNYCAMNSFQKARFYKFYRPQQAWALPDSIIYQITKYPTSAKAYQKMIQSCKYFFIKNPILVVSQFAISFYTKSYGFLLNRKYIDIKIKLQMISSKFWITKEIKFYVERNLLDTKTVISSLTPKIYRIDAPKFCNLFTTMLYKDFIFLASNCVNVKLSSPIIEDDGSIVKLEKLFKGLPNVRSFEYSCTFMTNEDISSNTVKELVRIPHFSALDELTINAICETFDIETFYDYIKENTKTTILLLNFNVSEAYTFHLGKIVNEILETTNHNYKIPLIEFREINRYFGLPVCVGKLNELYHNQN